MQTVSTRGRGRSQKLCFKEKCTRHGFCPRFPPSSAQRPEKLTQALLPAGKGDQNPGKVDPLPEIEA